MGGRWSLGWYHELLKHSRMNPQARRPSIDQLMQIHRYYYDKRLSRSQRWRLLTQHQWWLKARLNQWSRRQLERGGSVRLAMVRGKEQDYQLSLAPSMGWREGCLTVRLFMAGKPLLHAVVSLCSDPHDRLMIKIGAIQATSHEPREQLKLATRDCHGLQPRLLLMAAIRSWAMHIGAQSIEGVATQFHPFSSSTIFKKSKLKIEFESLWEMVGATLKDNGHWDIPLTKEQRPIESYPSAKRAQIKRSQAIIKAIDHEIKEGLHRYVMMSPSESVEERTLAVVKVAAR
jgi:uncharacterized protein VirK/YbjX